MKTSRVVTKRYYTSDVIIYYFSESGDGRGPFSARLFTRRARIRVTGGTPKTVVLGQPGSGAGGGRGNRIFPFVLTGLVTSGPTTGRETPFRVTGTPRGSTDRVTRFRTFRTFRLYLIRRRRTPIGRVRSSIRRSPRPFFSGVPPPSSTRKTRFEPFSYPFGSFFGPVADGLLKILQIHFSKLHE